MLRRVGANKGNSKVKLPETNEPYHLRNYLETRWDVNTISIHRKSTTEAIDYTILGRAGLENA